MNLESPCTLRGGTYHKGPMDIDLNSDLGEGCGRDADILPLVTSANVACGFHAGDYNTAFEALTVAARLGVRVGAHPGYADREHFGRREHKLSEDEIRRLCAYQIGAVLGLAKLAGTEIAYLKPHGALYHQACWDDAYARPVIDVAERFGLPVVGLPGSPLEMLCRGRCRFIAEGFADRRYLEDGSLVPRSMPDALVEDVAEAEQQAERLIRHHGVRTLCVHGDNPRALEFVRGLRQALVRGGMKLKAFA
jgi:UPF0271 protein